MTTNLDPHLPSAPPAHPAVSIDLPSSTASLHPASQDSNQPAEFPSVLVGKRLLLATESFGPVNGVSRTTRSLVQYLRDNGVQVAVVAPQYKGQPKARRSDKDAEVRLHGYPLPYNPDLTVAYPFRLDRLYARTFNPDIVYLASPASVGFQFLIQMRQLQFPPIVLANFQTDLSAYSEILFRGTPLDRFAVWILQVVQGFLYNHRAVHTVFYPSAGVRRYLEKAGAPRNKLVHLGRGVDTQLFEPSARDDTYRAELAPNGEIILVSVARLAPEKGFDFLARAAHALVAHNVPFKLVIVGGNRNPQVEEDVRSLFLQQPALVDRVVFTGFLEGRALARAYASGDIFVHCSVTETFGLVVLESMASGVPVIARDEGGPSEIVNHEVSGYLVPPADLDGFVSRVELLASDARLRNTMSLAARRQACDTTWEKINNRVAWQLADALNARAKLGQPPAAVAPTATETEVAERNSRTGPRIPPSNALSYFLSIADQRAAGRFLYSLYLALRLNAAIGLVFVFWAAVVIPMLVHGFVYRIA